MTALAVRENEWRRLLNNRSQESLWLLLQGYWSDLQLAVMSYGARGEVNLHPPKVQHAMQEMRMLLSLIAELSPDAPKQAPVGTVTSEEIREVGVPARRIREEEYHALSVEYRAIYEPDPIHPEYYQLRKWVPTQDIPAELRTLGRPYRIQGNMGSL